MPDRSAWVAWGLLVLGLLGNAAGLALGVADRRDAGHPEEVLLWVVFAAYLVVGCLILARRPGNIIGWIFTAVGLLTMVAGLADVYARYANAHPGSLPGPLVGIWIQNWIWLPTIQLALVFPLLLFPTGRSLSPRWRPVTWLAVGLTAAYAVLGALSPTLQMPNGRTVANPIGVTSIDLDAGPLGAVLSGLLLFVFFASISSLIIRFRRSQGVERQQLKWFTYATVVLVGGAVLDFSVSEATGIQWLGEIGFVLTMVGLAGLPIAIGIAVLRYRLYNIDRIINRTLVYGALTAMLLAVYVADIVLLQRIFVLLTGERSTFVVVASTLMIAALFNPLRRRIQSFIDRRFYRRKYDARKTLESFSARLRDETDLDAVSDDLVRVVTETMQPAHVSIWLRPDAVPRDAQAP
ncbi:MAG: hypothetical protein ACJ8BC_13570 [Gemmatimonadales bacterium]